MSNKMAVHHSSATDQWPTPTEFFDKLDSLFGFELDVCADASNTKCDKFYTVEQDSLQQDWTGVCWMNPPYGRDSKAGTSMYDWMKKAYESSRDNHATVVCLVPARPDNKWWQEWCIKGEMFFIKGRIKFEGAKDPAPFPSAIIVFRPRISEVLEGFTAAPVQ